MAAPFIGNNDYRGYLNYLGSQGDKSAKALLNYVGNDAGYDPNKLTTGDAQARNARLYAQYQALQNPTAAVTGKNLITPGYVAPAKAANFDIAGTFKSAYSQAAASQNALYDKYLNNFLDQQRNATAKQQNIYDTTNQALDTALKNTNEANAVAGTRQTEDTTNAENQINQTQDNMQTDTGSKFAIDRIQQARDLAKSGSTGGLSAQKTADAQQARNTDESRQVQQFDTQKVAQELVKARTFEDLATSSRLAAEKTATGKKQAQFDLDNYIVQAQLQEQAYRDKDQADRQAAIREERDRIAKEQFNNYLTTLSDPVRIATAAKYQGSFG